MLWIGMYAPLSMVSTIAYLKSLQCFQLENDEGETYCVEFKRIEWHIDGYVYDITWRALWYLHFIGNYYDGFIHFATCSLPWNDLQNSKFADDANVIYFYYTTTELNNESTDESTDESADGSTDESTDESADGSAIRKKSVIKVLSKLGKYYHYDNAKETNDIMYNQITFV